MLFSLCEPSIGHLYDEGVIGKALVRQSPDWCKLVGLTWYDAPRLERNDDSELAAVAMRLGAGVEFGAEYPNFRVWDVNWSDNAISFDNWLGNFYGRRDEKSMVREYTAARERYLIKGCGDDLNVEANLKDERYAGKLNEVKPRLVMKVGDLSQQVEIAPFATGLTMSIKDYCRTVDESIVYECGMTAEEVGAWMEARMQEFPIAIENDYSQFESRVTYEALHANHRFYADSGAPPNTRKQFRTYYNPIFRLNGRKFRRIASRVSGVADTSLGNSHANALAIAGILAELGYLKGIDYALIVKGDDSVLFCTEQVLEDLPLIEERIAALGHKAKMVVRTRADYDLIEYCSCRFIRASSGEMTMVTKFGKMLANGVHCPPTADWTKYVVPMMIQHYQYSPSTLTQWWAWRWLTVATETPEIPEPEVDTGHLAVYGLTPQQFKEGLGTPAGPVWRIPDNHVTRVIVETDCPVDTTESHNNYRPPVPFVAPMRPKSSVVSDTVKIRAIIERKFKTNVVDWPDIDCLGWEHLPLT